MRSLLLVGLLCCCGCSMISGTRKPDGTMRITSWRALWKSELITFRYIEIPPGASWSSTNGWDVEITIGKSSTDKEALAAVADAAVKAAIKSAVPIP